MAARGAAGASSAGKSPGCPTVRSSTPCAPSTGSIFSMYQPASRSYSDGLLPSERGAALASSGSTVAVTPTPSARIATGPGAVISKIMLLAPRRLNLRRHAWPAPRRGALDATAVALPPAKRANTALAGNSSALSPATSTEMRCGPEPWICKSRDGDTPRIRKAWPSRPITSAKPLSPPAGSCRAATGSRLDFAILAVSLVAPRVPLS